MYSALMMLALTSGSDVPACGRHCCRPVYRGPVYYCPPVYYPAVCGYVIVQPATTGTGGTDNTQTVTGTDNTGSTGGTGEFVKWTPEEVSSVKAALKEREISDEDSDKFVQAAQELKLKSDEFMDQVKDLFNDPDLKNRKGKDAAGSVQTLIDSLKKALGGISQLPAPAILVVALPADAKLTIDGELTTSTSASRQFVSPPLEAGATYFYTLQAQVERNGEKLVATREVAVRAGEATQVVLEPKPAVKVAQK